MVDNSEGNKKENGKEGENRPRKYRSTARKYKRMENYEPDRQYIEDMCYKEGLLGNNVFNTCYSMLKEVRKKRYKESNEPSKTRSKEEIAESKLNVRADFLEAVTVPLEESEGEQDRIIREAVELPWIDEKLDAISAKMKEYPKWGKQYVEILDACYFHPVEEIDEVTKKPKDIWEVIGMSKSRFYARHREAVMLLGIELWRYAKRREIEDMENGIIPWHDIYPDRPGDEIPDRRKNPRDEQSGYVS